MMDRQTDRWSQLQYPHRLFFKKACDTKVISYLMGGVHLIITCACGEGVRNENDKRKRKDDTRNEGRGVQEDWGEKIDMF